MFSIKRFKREEIKYRTYNNFNNLLSTLNISFCRRKKEEEKIKNFLEISFLEFIVIFKALDLLSLHFCKHLVDQKYP